MSASEKPTPPSRPRPQFQRNSSVGIRRLPSYQSQSQSLRLQTPQDAHLGRTRTNTDVDDGSGDHDEEPQTRRRSFSAPERPDPAYLAQANNSNRPVSGVSTSSSVRGGRPMSGGTALQDIAEGEEGRTPRHGGGTPVFELPGSIPEEGSLPQQQGDVPRRNGSGSRRFRSSTVGARLGMGSSRGGADVRSRLQRNHSEMSSKRGSREYESSIVDVLDVVDPYVSTLTTLNNVQNSLFVPDLGRFLNRKPTYELYGNKDIQAETEKEAAEVLEILDNLPEEVRPTSSKEQEPDSANLIGLRRTSTTNTLATITSQLSASRYAVLPHGYTLDNWTQEDKDLLNDHVRHLLHSKREKFKRQARAFRNYVRKPLGLFVTVYAFLVTTFGLVWVLFLIGWISGGSQHEYFINIIDNILVALFALIGDVLAPFRAVDTYHMIYIVHYHRLTWKLRQKNELPSLADPNDLPAASREDIDLEAAFKRDQEASVLSPAQQAKLEHHQAKFAKSHTFYRPHETETHFAFSVRILCLVVVLLDLHSCFQIALGSITWSWSYHTRPQWLTAVVLALSLTCNISGGIWISIGDHRSRKKDVLERMFRQELTKEAINKVERARSVADQVGRSRKGLSSSGSGSGKLAGSSRTASGLSQGVGSARSSSGKVNDVAAENGSGSGSGRGGGNGARPYSGT